MEELDLRKLDLDSLDKVTGGSHELTLEEEIYGLKGLVKMFKNHGFSCGTIVNAMTNDLYDKTLKKRGKTKAEFMQILIDAFYEA